jgi:hypothetical protein
LPDTVSISCDAGSIENTKKPFQDILCNWPQAAQTYFCTLRDIVHDAAKVAKIGALTETLKCGSLLGCQRHPVLDQLFAQVGRQSGPKHWAYFSTVTQRFLKQCAL